MALDVPDVGEDLASAATLPSAWYTDPEALARERGAVFARTWQLAAPLTQLAAPGDYVTCDVAGEPLILVREGAGKLRAFSAVCRHRAGPVACGAGNRRSFQCGYHGWTYGLDGQLLTAPEFEGVRGFDRAAVRLPEVRPDTWGPLAFVNLDSAAPSLADWMPEVFANEGPRASGLILAERREWRVKCNWKVYVDNYLEGYHIPIVHPGLFRELDYGAYRVETYEHVSAQIAPIRPGSGPARRYPSEVGKGQEAVYLWVFPNLMLNLYPDNLQVNLVLPVGQEETRTVFEWFVPADRGADDETITKSVAFADEVQREDIAICEAVQRGLRSRTYDRGRYSVRRENGVHHFHRLLARFLTNGPGSSPGTPGEWYSPLRGGGAEG